MRLLMRRILKRDQHTEQVISRIEGAKRSRTKRFIMTQFTKAMGADRAAAGFSAAAFNLGGPTAAGDSLYY